MRHRQLEPARQRGAIADLHGQTLRRPMQHGLAVKADERDRAALDIVLLEEGLDGFGMHRA